MTWYQRDAAKRASERGRRMAGARWAADRRRRDRLAALEPLQYPGRIVLRVVVIREERAVREAIVFDTDSGRDARRKIRAVLGSGDLTPRHQDAKLVRHQPPAPNP